MSEIPSFSFPLPPPSVPAGGQKAAYAKAGDEAALVPQARVEGRVGAGAVKEAPQPAVEELAKSNFKADSREAVVEQAARRYAADTFYPLSSVRFTIYKGASGEYVTRFTNMQDGSVTYVPEPDLMKNLARLRESEPYLLGTYA